MYNFLAGVPSGIFEKVAQFISGIIDKGVTMLQGLDWWMQAIVLLVAALLILIGLIRLIVKSWKIVIVLGVIGAIGFVAYKYIKKGDTATTEAIIQGARYFLMFL